MKKKLTTTKRILGIILCIALIDLQLSYVLAFLGRDNIAESLGIAIVTEIIAVFLGYCCKAFFETREEEKNTLEREKMNQVNEDNGEEIAG